MTDLYLFIRKCKYEQLAEYLLVFGSKIEKKQLINETLGDQIVKYPQTSKKRK
jgi:hypothetical protein